MTSGQEPPGLRAPFYWTRQGLSLQEVEARVQELLTLLNDALDGVVVGGGGSPEQWAAVVAQVEAAQAAAEAAQAAAEQAQADATVAVVGKVSYPTGGVDGAVLAKSGSAAAWSSVTTDDLMTSTNVTAITYSATAPTGSAAEGVFVITPV